MNRFSVVVSAVFIVAFAANSALAQKSGQSVSITYGVVVGSKPVTESSDAGKGALIGGTIGLLASSGKSSKKKRRYTAGGAVVGGVAANAAQGDRSAKEYQVDTGGGMTIIISDQTEIVVGDCVVVENGGRNKANIRRVSPTLCEPESEEVVESIREEMVEEAMECLAAKDELLAAQDDASFDRAIRKVDIFCDD